MGQISLGKIGRAFGIKGFVFIHSFTDPADAIFDYKNWTINLKGISKPLKILEQKESNKGFVVRFDGFEDRTQAETLRNLEIFILKEDLPPLPSGEYYWVDLLGLKVINEAGICLGIVDSLIPTGSNDVLVVKPESQDNKDKIEDPEYLIPYIPDYVLSVDLAKSQIRVHWEPEY